MEHIDFTQLKNNLQAYRVKKGLSQQEAADILQISLSTMKNWEKNPQKMTFEKLLVLANLYQVKVSDFFVA